MSDVLSCEGCWRGGMIEFAVNQTNHSASRVAESIRDAVAGASSVVDGELGLEPMAGTPEADEYAEVRREVGVIVTASRAELELGLPGINLQVFACPAFPNGTSPCQARVEIAGPVLYEHPQELFDQ